MMRSTLPGRIPRIVAPLEFFRDGSGARVGGQTWIGTGNNVVLGTEMAWRDAKPAKRTEFKKTDQGPLAIAKPRGSCQRRLSLAA